jgi:branched-chain amino acid transport system ATP-binding protein
MIVDGPPEEIQKNPEVIKAYLGEEDLYASRK